MSLDGIIKLMLAFRYDTEAKVYVGFCPNLNIYSQGRTEIEAEDSLNDAIRLFVKHGGLEKLLEKHSLTKIAAFPEKNRSALIQIDNFNSVANFDLPVQFGRSETCQPCA